MSDASWGGLSVLNLIGGMLSQAAGLGWYVAGPLALKSAGLFSSEYL
jgi:hypothetical protein